MENQHKMIKGYRDLSLEEVGLMNRIKTKGAELLALQEELANRLDTDFESKQAEAKRSRQLSTHKQESTLSRCKTNTKPPFSTSSIPSVGIFAPFCVTTRMEKKGVLGLNWRTAAKLQGWHTNEIIPPRSQV